MIRSVLLALAVFSAATSAHALPFGKNTGATFSQQTSNAAKATWGNVPNASRTFSTTNGKPTVTTPIAGSAWNNFMASARAMAEPSELAKSFATGRGLMLPVAMLGSALALLADTACVEVAGGTLTQGAAWNECNFREQGTTQWIARTFQGTYPYGGDWQASSTAACQKVADYVRASNAGGDPYRFPVTGASVTECNTVTLAIKVTYTFTDTWYNSSHQGQVTAQLQSRQATEKVRDGWKPTTPENAETKLRELLEEYCTEGDPKCHQAMESLVDAGVEVEVGMPTVTGPATTGPTTQQSTSTRTVTNPDGSTTTLQITNTTTSTFNYTYNGDTVTRTVTTTTVTQTYNPDTGQTTTETVTDNKPAPPQEGEPEENVPPVLDADMPPVPDLYTQKYPDGLAGVWNAAADGFKQTPIFTFLAGLAPQTPGVGCPVWTFPQSQVLGIQVGGDISVPCYVWVAIRLFMIITALMLARRLIFGG